MPVTDDQVATLHAMIANDRECYEELCGQLSRGDWVHEDS
jgi:hypothetical protein